MLLIIHKASTTCYQYVGEFTKSKLKEIDE